MKVSSNVVLKIIELTLGFVASLFTGKEREPAKLRLERRERARAQTEPPIPITWSDSPDTPTAPAIPRQMPPRKPPAVTKSPAPSVAAKPSAPKIPPRRH